MVNAPSEYKLLFTNRILGLEKARNAIWKCRNRAGAKATSPSNASARARHSRTTQSDIVHTPPDGNGAVDQIDHRGMATDNVEPLPDTGAALDLPVGSSSALQHVIQVPNPGYVLDNNGGMEMDEMTLPDAGTGPALPAGSSNAARCIIQSSNPGDALDLAESCPSEMQIEDDS